jgi:Concanavalin A-like lectin/glucanases superfamily
MKNHPYIPAVLASLWTASFTLFVTTTSAATLVPGATGDAAVAAAIAGRPNLALASAGATAFSSSDLGATWSAPDVNDGVTDQFGNSWIPATTDATEFIGIAFPNPITLGAVVWHGQTGYNGRSAGTWSLQYTTEANPGAGSTWTDIGTYVYVEAGCATPMPRTLFSVPSVAGVTGMRLVLLTSDCGIQLAVQEFEAYEPVSSPPVITQDPVGGTVVTGGDFTFTVTATGAESFQWRKDGVDIPGASGANYKVVNAKFGDAGDYDVVVSNPAGSVPSAAATLMVDPAPVYNTYQEAVLTDNPIHYYPLDDTSGTTATDLGSLATSGGTFNGGITLDQPSATDRLGRSVLLDGAAGTLVDLGLFHPGDAVTIEAWAKLDPTAANNPQYYAIVTRWDGSYELDFAPGDVANFVVRNQDNAFAGAVAASASARAQWHHLVGIFSDGVATIFVDGVQGSAPNIGGVLQDAGPDPDRVMIGATRSGTVSSFNFKGCIDEVAIYDYALSAAQIRTHFRTAQPPEPPALTIERAVIVSWPTFPPGYKLQSSPTVDGTYEDVTAAPVVDNGINRLAVPLEGPEKFYRLLQE